MARLPRSWYSIAPRGSRRLFNARRWLVARLELVHTSKPRLIPIALTVEGRVQRQHIEDFIRANGRQERIVWEDKPRPDAQGRLAWHGWVARPITDVEIDPLPASATL